MNNPRVGPPRGRLLLVALSVLSLTAVMLAPVAAVADEPIQAIVVVSGDEDYEALAESLGGGFIQRLSIIDGFSAVFDESAIAEVRDHPAVADVFVDGSLHVLDDGWEDASYVLEKYEAAYAGSMYQIIKETIKAKKFHEKGYYGSGIDVALIDTGVVPVGALDGQGKVVNGLDISFESQSDDLRYLDTFGHGTHLAGIIAGYDSSTGFMGIAPGSRLLNVKVAGHDGAVDVSQVIAAIDWVVQHRNDNGMNVRVINLAYGTDSTQAWKLDPLAMAVEQAWRAGIVVVVASGNDGNATALRNPAIDPYVIAVGASDSNSSPKIKDDFAASFTSCGTSSRYVDVLAPGRSIISLRNPGSVADVEYPEARIGDDMFLGSGTSQASAIVAGAVALALDRYPDATPDQIKAALMYTSQEVDSGNKYCARAGIINLEWLFDKFGDTNDLAQLDLQSYGSAVGSGSLESARGSHHVGVDGVVLRGEQDIFGIKWDSAYLSKLAAYYKAWDGGDFNGNTWSGGSWSGTSWSGTSWSGTSWSGTSWSGTSWSDYVWSGTSWSGTSWSGTSWSGTSWSDYVWSGTSWSNDNWLGLSWS